MRGLNVQSLSALDSNGKEALGHGLSLQVACNLFFDGAFVYFLTSYLSESVSH
jgi:hypothetical protein